MMRALRSGWWTVLVVAAFALTTPAHAQDGSAYRTADRAPAVPRRVTLDLTDVPLRDALKAVASQGGVSLIYASSIVPLDRRISLQLRAVSVEDALRGALRGTDVDVRETSSGQLMLVRAPAHADSADSKRVVEAGGIAGRVTDAATGAAVVRAVVGVDGGAWRALTDDEGRYRLTEIPAGVHVVGVAHSVDHVARALALNRKTLANHCRAAGFPPPGAVIAWCLILLTTALLASPGITVERVAMQLDFPSATALRNMLKRYTGLRPADLRNATALGTLCTRFLDAGTRAPAER
jgi:AraC-like DNA-binding protein